MQIKNVEASSKIEFVILGKKYEFPSHVHTCDMAWPYIILFDIVQ